jgi:hypothetical protein
MALLLEACELGLATLREAAVCSPMVLTETKAGERAITKMLGDGDVAVAQAIKLGRSALGRDERVVVACLGFLVNEEEGRFDALVLEGMGPEEQTSVLMVQRLTEPQSEDEPIEPVGNPRIYEDEAMARRLTRPPRWRRRWFP